MDIQKLKTNLSSDSVRSNLAQVQRVCTTTNEEHDNSTSVIGGVDGKVSEGGSATLNEEQEQSF